MIETRSPEPLEELPMSHRGAVFVDQEDYDTFGWGSRMNPPLPPGAPEFDSPGECVECGERVGAWIEVIEGQWGGEIERPMISPFWIIDGSKLICEDCYPDLDKPLYEALAHAASIDPDYAQRQCGIWTHVDDLDEPCDCEDCTKKSR